MWERFIYSHYRSYLESLFPVLRERTLGSTTEAVEQIVHINNQHTNVQFGKLWIINGKQLILVVNFLFGLKVGAIANKTFILDFHRRFFCSVVLKGLCNFKRMRLQIPFSKDAIRISGWGTS
jgi:hypothetical protein